MTMRPDQIRQYAAELAEQVLIKAADSSRPLDSDPMSEADDQDLRLELRAIAETLAKRGATPSARSAADPGDWHKVHDEDYEDALLRASGAMVGYTAGMSEPFRWTPVVLEAFRGAVAEAFNRGFETGRAVNV